MTTAGPGTAPPPTTRPTVPVPTWVDANGFNDHSVPSIESVPEYFALARGGVSGQSVVKFTIANMTFGPQISWMDSNFYTLHDEWYWFRLLNDAAVVGSDELPTPGRRFESVADIYKWAAAVPSSQLPYGLTFVGSQSVGNRLYSNHFYDLALNFEPRAFGLGSLVYYPTSSGGGGERWVIELEYHDDPTPREVAQFFEMIAATVPPEIGDKLEWVIRSPVQERVAQIMASGDLAFNDRIVHFNELIEPGQVAVYNEGIAAGRLLLIGEGGKDITDATSNDILLVENVPDFLPQGRALISSSPQTPLAHINLLARNRGIPNASQAGVLQDAGVQQAARVRAPAIVRASAADGLEIVLITEAQYDQWRALNSVSPVSVPRIETGSQPNVIDLDSITNVRTEGDLAAWRPLIGGKASGFIHMMAAESVSLPSDPVAITVRPYFEHLAKVEDALRAMQANTSFAGSRRTRYLMLQGPADYADFYADVSDREFAETFAVANPAGTPIGDILAAGGFQDYFRDVPMSAAALGDITAQLQSTFADLALSQGLRFRSSSTVEDIEGFNGAGLYDSNTGFFRPDIQLESKDHKKSIEWAIKATWASYWGFEAFEERRREGIVHESGGMAVLVHARFDDPLELGNGVFTVTLLPGIDADDTLMILNVQEGDVSVSNPDPALGASPEIVEVRHAGAEAPRITRIADSNLVQEGLRVLDDGQVTSLFDQGVAVARLWRDRINASLPEAQQIGTLTLDFEFKEMAAGWPALEGGQTNPARLVVKQARTLEPGLRDVPAGVQAMPIPRDVLARARLVEQVTCDLDSGDGPLTVSGVEVLTDPLLVPDVGFGSEPFIVTDDSLYPVLRGAASCRRQILHSTPDQFLIELLGVGELLNLSQ